MSRLSRIIQPADYNIIKRMADSTITEDISNEFLWSGTIAVGTSGPMWNYKSHVNNSDADELIGLQISCDSAEIGGISFASILPPSLIGDTGNKLVNSLRRIVAWSVDENAETVSVHWLGLVPRGYELVFGFTSVGVMCNLLHGESRNHNAEFIFAPEYAPPPMVTIYK